MKARNIINRHHKYGWVLTLFAIVLVFGVYFRQDPIDAAVATFTQENWADGIGGSAVHSSNQTGWTYYDSLVDVTATSSLGLTPSYYMYHEGATGATTTSSIVPTGGTFNSGTLSNIVLRNVSGIGGSLELERSATAHPTVSSGATGTYLVKADGTVWSWGSNTSGALGYSPVVNNTTAGQVQGEGGVGFLSNVVSVSSGAGFTAALKSDGTVWSWGEGSGGQLGNGGVDDQSYPVQVVDYNGGVPIPLTNITSVSLGGYHSLALKDDGTVWAWGTGNYGVLGTGQSGEVASAFQVLGPGGTGYLADIVAVSAGSYTSYALKSDGTVWAWGFGQFGNIGDGGTTQDNSYPIQVHGENNLGYLTNIVSISAGLRTAYALHSDGGVYAWGYGEDGELGDNNIGHNVSSPVRILGENGTGYLSNISVLEAGSSAGYAIDRDGVLWAWGSGNGGELGNGGLVSQATPVRVQGVGGAGYLENVIEVSGGQNFAAAVLADGSVYSWGIGSWGQLGNNTTTATQATPVQVLDAPVFDYFHASTTLPFGVSGDHATYAVKTDGTLWSWGANFLGQLGNGTSLTTSGDDEPARVVGVGGSGYLEDVIGVAHAETGGYALKLNGTVYSWGYNDSGQLGDGTNDNSNVPVQVSGLTGVTQVAGGNGGSGYALKSDGTVWSWGRNEYGQLGNGTNDNSNIPVQVSGLTDITQVSGGGFSGYALKNDGTVWSWGLNSYGQLGDGTNDNSNVPVQVSGLTGVTQIAGGHESGYAVTSGGYIYSWGRNYFGQLGDGSWTNSSLPVQVVGEGGSGNLSNVVMVSAYLNGNAYALTSDGAVWAWGVGSQGALGNGTNPSSQTTPVRVKVDSSTNLNGFRLYPYGRHVIANDGKLWGWGINGYGNLGNNSLTDSLYAVQSYNELAPVPISAGSAVYGASGTFTSGSIELGEAKRFSTFTAQSFVPANTSLAFEMRAGTDGIWTDWSALVPGDNGAMDISAFSNEDHLQYRVTFASSDPNVSPILYGVTVNYAASYPTTGELVSSVYDTEDVTNRITKVTWTSFADETDSVKIQVRTSPDNSTWSDWCGMSETSTCGGSLKFEPSDNGGDIGLDNPLRTGGDDRYFQYKVILEGDVATTPYVTSIQIEYAFNEPPDFDMVDPHSNGIVASQASSGEVNIEYYVRDTDTLSSTSMAGFITPTFEYTTDGSTWNSIPSDDMTVSSTANKAVGETAYTTHTATWYASSTSALFDTVDAQVRITVDDNEAAHNTATVTTPQFSLDTVGPVVSALTAPTGGRTTTSAQITFTTNETAVGYVEYSTQTEDDYHNISSPTASGTSHDITLSGLPTDTVYVYRAYAVDAFGNIGSPTLGGTFTVGTPSLLSFTDDGATSTTSNLAVTGGDFDLGSYSSTEVSGSGVGGSVVLSTGSGGGIVTPKAQPGLGLLLKSDGTVWVSSLGSLPETPVQAIPAFGIDLSTLPSIQDILYGGNVIFLAVNGEVWGIGDNDHGGLGDGTFVDSYANTQALMPVPATAIATGYGGQAVYALTATGDVYAWGQNDFGQIGDGTTTDRNTPVQVVGLPSNIISIAAAGLQGYALTADGNVWAWGGGNSGLLGDGLETNSSVPVQVSISNVTEISASYNHVLALDTNGNVWAWGNNYKGKLGDGTESYRNVPVKVVDPLDGSGFLTGVLHVSAGMQHSLVIKNDDTVWGWGDNTTGALGVASDPVLNPTHLSEFTDVASVHGGVMNTAIIKTDGSVWSEGSNNMGQLLDGTTTNSTTPVQAGAPTLFNVGASASYETSGTFTSNIINLAQDAEFTTLNYNTTLSGQTIAVDVRAGTTPTYNASTWTDWLTDIASGGDISDLTTTSPKQYFQYRVRYTTSDTGVTPTFNQLTVFYTQYTQDVGPGEEVPPAPAPSTGSNAGTVTPEGQPRNPAPAPVVPEPSLPVPENPVIVPNDTPVPPPFSRVTDNPLIPPEIIQIVQEQHTVAQQEIANDADRGFFGGLFGGEVSHGAPTPSSSSVPTFTTFVTDSVVKGITTITDLPPVRTTLDATTRVIEDPVGAIVTKVAATAGVVSGTAIAATSLFLNPLALAELFLVPARLMGIILSALGIRKRTRRWGTVYDSVTKQPLDPAYVVLKDKDGNEVGTGITDLDGRYGFLIGPGTYTIVANKTNYTFPSKKLAGKTRDVLYDDLYFGEELTLGKDGAVITKNIPLDPQGFDWNEFTKQDQKLMKFHGKRDTLFQTIATYTLFIGLPIAVAGYLVTPAPYNTIIVGIYALLFILRMFGLKPKSHGLLTDMEGNPLSYAIVRVHDVNQGGKEIFHRVADAQGRYYCLVQKGQYTITVEKKNPDESYSLVYTSPVIDAKKGVIRDNIKI